MLYTAYFWINSYVALRNYLILLDRRLSSLDDQRQGSLLCQLGPMYVVSFYIVWKHNSHINWALGLGSLCTSDVIERPSLEGLSTKPKEASSPPRS